MISKGIIKLNNVEALVLDEADRMLDMGFKDDIDSILNAIKQENEKNCQIALFSATIPSWIQNVATTMMGDYKFFNFVKNLKNKSAKNITHLCIKA